jgi:1,2-dihydroxy-3-keto-5-methylthiopentene dioxygenase
MTALHVFQRPQTTDPIQSLSGFDDIRTFLSQAGIVLERWDVSGVDKRTDGTQLLAQFHDSIEALKQREGYQSADVIALTPDHKDRIALREKFLQEHTHSEDEVRLFVHGSGTFFVPVGNQVVKLVCHAGICCASPPIRRTGLTAVNTRILSPSASSPTRKVGLAI